MHKGTCCNVFVLNICLGRKIYAGIGKDIGKNMTSNAEADVTISTNYCKAGLT